MNLWLDNFTLKCIGQNTKMFKLTIVVFMFVQNFHSWGATPDGVVSCSCYGKGLLEIKCSFMHQNENPLDACLDSHYHVYKDENNCLRLKESSSWHTQIQGQMGICKRQWCDFVFFTKKGIAVDRTIFDKNQYNDIIVKCEKFFHKYVVQAIQSD
ncbi:unnamed protein product [Mytilus edulis]|uniref:YqaJ viral recombinase domain-containing protein n=1 Tax=Mytilus edulis TaxID=6550 RepID=A0A8S3S9K0_MYTED|nr:unnamed protein product [Mytilus edulis]